MQLAWLGAVTPFFSKSATRGSHPKKLFAALLLLAPLSSALAGTLYIGGAPAPSIGAPAGYYFRPWIAGSDKPSAKFTIRNKPYWASFDATTGTLTGKVYPVNAGTYSNIVISASSSSSSSKMPPFSITVTQKSTTPSGPPTISGIPSPTTISVGSAFNFQPTASDPAGRKLTFSVSNKPAWASFDTSSGRLFGTPSSAAVGTTSNIIIVANDGVASASLKAFSLTVVNGGSGNGSATLSWSPPTTDVNGNVLTALSGYQIKYGTNASALSQSVQVNNPGLTSYVISNLTPGTYYFGVTALTSTGAQSKLSGLVSKTIR